MNIDPMHCTGICDCGGPLTWSESNSYRVAVCCECYRPYVWSLTQPPPSPSPFRLGEAVPRDTPEASNVRVVPEPCDLTAAERATSERLLASVFTEG